MRSLALALLFVPLALSARGESRDVIVSPVLSATATVAGQPLTLPQAEPQVIVSRFEIAPGAKLPVHKHRFLRYAYVLSGTLSVTDEAAGTSTEYRAGEFIIEMLDRWHFGENVGRDPVRLLVIDQVEKGQSNTITK